MKLTVKSGNGSRVRSMRTRWPRIASWSAIGRSRSSCRRRSATACVDGGAVCGVARGAWGVWRETEHPDAHGTHRGRARTTTPTDDRADGAHRAKSARTGRATWSPRLPVLRIVGRTRDAGGCGRSPGSARTAAVHLVTAPIGRCEVTAVRRLPIVAEDRPGVVAQSRERARAGATVGIKP